MNLTTPHIDLTSQEITPAKLAWIMGVGESTVADWIKNRELDYFKKGRLIRFSPEAVAEFVREYTVRKSNGVHRRSLITSTAEERPEFWERMQRLIEAVIESRLAAAAAAYPAGANERREAA